MRFFLFQKIKQKTSYFLLKVAGPDSCHGLLDRKLSSIFWRGKGNDQELWLLTKSRKQFLLIVKEESRAFFFLEKSDGLLFLVVGVEDLPIRQEVEEPFSFDIGGSFLLLYYGEVEKLIRCFWRLGRGLARSEISSIFHIWEASNQEAKELSARRKLSPTTTKKLGKDLSCLRIGSRRFIFSLFALGGRPEFSPWNLEGAPPCLLKFIFPLPTRSLSLAKKERQSFVANWRVSRTFFFSREVGGSCLLCWDKAFFSEAFNLYLSKDKVEDFSN